MNKTILTLLLGGLLLMTPNANAADIKDPENTLYLQVEGSGTVTIELLPDIAPNHVERLKTLARKGFYDGIVFHRVIDGFMAQTGDPTGTGMGGSDLPDLAAEFNDTNFGRGTVGMARSASPDSGNSQFFICFDDCSFLNGQYTVFGQVIDGMDVVDGIKKGEPPANPDKISKMVVAADVKTGTDASPEKEVAPKAEASGAPETPASADTPEAETAVENKAAAQ
jgi:peptidylprolyl isomerase